MRTRAYSNGGGLCYLNTKQTGKVEWSTKNGASFNLFANNTEYAPYLHEFGHKHYEDTVKNLANKGKNKL